MFPRAACCALYLLLLCVEANDEAWSQQTYLNAAHRMFCNDTMGNFTVGNDVRVIWKKLDSDHEIITDSNYDLSDNNLSLVIRRVTSQLSGIYICDVYDIDGRLVLHTIKGVNIDGFLYDDLFEKYKTNFLRGLITTVSVFVIVVGTCVIDRFKYTSVEQNYERIDGKQEQSCLYKSQNAVKNNIGMTENMEDNNIRNYGSLKTAERATHL